MLNSFIGDILLQTGQALQRTAARAVGKDVLMPLRYKSVGLIPIDPCYSVDIRSSTYLLGDVRCDADITIGENCIIRAETSPVYLYFKSNIGDNCVITSIEPKLELEKMAYELPRSTIIGQETKIGNNCVVQNAFVGHHAILEDNVVVGHGAIVETKAVVKEGSVVPPGAKIPSSQIWGGNPIQFQGHVSKDDH